MDSGARMPMPADGQSFGFGFLAGVGDIDLLDALNSHPVNHPAIRSRPRRATVPKGGNQQRGLFPVGRLFISLNRTRVTFSPSRSRFASLS